jgi:hypothetical protein
MTKDFTVSGICQAKKGLMFLRDCGAPAVGNCRLCARPICEIHRIADERGGLCPECGLKEGKTPDPAAGRLSNFQSRNDYYDRFHYAPIYYGHSHYFSDTDYRTFDRSSDQGTTGFVDGSVEAIQAEAGGDPGDLDDFMES